MSDKGEHLDFEALNELKLVMEDEFTVLVETFTNDSIVRIESIKEAVESGEPESIRRSAHSFKGSAGNMGAIQLSELCRLLEELGHSGQIAGSQALMEQIIEEYEQVKEAFSQF